MTSEPVRPAGPYGPRSMLRHTPEESITKPSGMERLYGIAIYEPTDGAPCEWCLNTLAHELEDALRDVPEFAVTGLAPALTEMGRQAVRSGRITLCPVHTDAIRKAIAADAMRKAAP